MSQSPFKFLDSYTREDHDIYFGRTNETEALYTAVFKSKMVLLYGVSGTGKSSLIQCGLANKFQESDWLPVFVRRGRDMLDSLFQSLIQTHIEAPRLPKKRTAKSFLKLLQSLYLDHFKPVYLIFDQFEELFIFGNKEERNEFVQLMEALQQSEVQVKVIFSIREEYLALLTEFEDRLPELFQNRIRVERMHFPQAKEVIQGACQYANIEIEEGFEEQLLEKLTGGKKELELTYLQVLLDRLWKKSEEGKNGFTLTLLESMGHISDLLGQFLEEQINELEVPEQGLTVLKTFVSVQGTKKQLTFEEINQGCLSLGQELDEKAIQDLLHRFTDLRILRDKDESGRYELRHDSLAAKIYEKITLAEKELMEVRQFVEQAYQLYEKKGIILSKDSLDYIAPYRQRMFLKQKIRDFVDASRHYYVRKAKRRRRILTWSTSAALLIAIVSGIFIWRDLQATKETARIATAHNLANQSLDLLQDDPKQAFKTAVDAYNMEPDYLSKKAVMNAFYQGPFERYELNTSMKEVDFTLDGNYIVMTSKYGVDSKVEVYDFETGDAVCVFNKKGTKLVDPIDCAQRNNVPVIYDTSKHLFVTAYEDSSFVLWTTNGEIIKEIDTKSKIISYWKQNDNVFLALGNCIVQYNLSGEFQDEIDCDFTINNVMKTDSTIVILSLTKNKKEGFAFYNPELDHKIKEVFLPEHEGGWRFSRDMKGYWMTDLSGKRSYILIQTQWLSSRFNDILFLYDISENLIKVVSNKRWQRIYKVKKINHFVVCIDLIDEDRTYQFFEIKSGALMRVIEELPQSIKSFERINDSLLVIKEKTGSSCLYDFQRKELISQYKNLVLLTYTTNGNGCSLWLKDVNKNQLLVINIDGDTVLNLSNKFLGASWSLVKLSDRELLLNKQDSREIYFISSETFLFRLWRKGDEKEFSKKPIAKSNRVCEKYFVQNCKKGGKSMRVYSIDDFVSWDFVKSIKYIDNNSTEHYGGINLHDDKYILTLDESKSKLFLYDFVTSKNISTISLKDTVSYLNDFLVLDSVIVLITDKGLFRFDLKNGGNSLVDSEIKDWRIKRGCSDSCFFYVYSSFRTGIIAYNRAFKRISVCKVPDSIINSKYIYSEGSKRGCDKLVLLTRGRNSIYLFNEELLNFDYICDISIYPKRNSAWFILPSVMVSGDSLFVVAMLDSVKLYNFQGHLLYSYRSKFEYVHKCAINFNGTQIILLANVGDKSFKGGFSRVFVNDIEVAVPNIEYQNSHWTGSMHSQYKNNTIESNDLYFDCYLNELFNLAGYQNFNSIPLGSDDYGFSNQLLLEDYEWLYRRDMIQYKYSSKPYLLKLPVTVPRMFEVLQESGLDTTYGFDNIPKNF